MIRQALENSYHLMQQGIEVSGETLTQLEQAKAEYEAAFLYTQLLYKKVLSLQAELFYVQLFLLTF
jgi:hypothetical protein